MQSISSPAASAPPSSLPLQPPLGSGDSRGWRKLVSFPVLLAVILGTLVYAFDSGGIADPDIWWHLRNAEVLVQTHSMVRSDLYSFTVPGAPWFNESWLSELPYYFAWQWMGTLGLFLVMLLQIELIIFGVYGLAYLSSKNVKAAFVASWLAVWLATVSFGPRTLLAGWLCLVAELFLLWQFREGKDRSWLLPLLFAVWVNVHGSWVIGMVLFAIFIGSGLIQGTWGRLEAVRWTPAQRSKIGLMGILSVAALFLNPYTYHLVFFPFDLGFRQKLNISHIEEWQSLDFHDLRGKILFGMLAATIILALVRKRRWRVEEVLFLLVAFYSAMTYSRFLFLAAIMLTPLLAKELDFLPPYNPRIDKYWLNALLIVAMLAGCARYLPTRERLQRNLVKQYPVKAIPYLQQLNLKGRVFNHCLWGGYLILNARNVPVFIDSRIDIYERGGVFADYLDAIGIVKPLEVLDKYHIRYVLFEKNSPLTYLLRHTSGWKINYEDGTTVLFERVGSVP